MKTVISTPYPQCHRCWVVYLTHSDARPLFGAGEGEKSSFLDEYPYFDSLRHFRHKATLRIVSQKVSDLLGEDLRERKVGNTVGGRKRRLLYDENTEYDIRGLWGTVLFVIMLCSR